MSKIEEDISINLGLLYDFLEKKSVQKCGLQKKGHFKVHPVNVDFPTIQGPTSCRTQMEQTFQVSQFGIFNSTHPKPIFFAKKFETQKPVFSLTRFCPLKAGQKPLMKTLKFRLWSCELVEPFLSCTSTVNQKKSRILLVGGHVGFPTT